MCSSCLLVQLHWRLMVSIALSVSTAWEALLPPWHSFSPSHPSHCASICLLLLLSEARCFAATFFFPGKKKQPPSNSPCHESGFQFAACAARWGWEQVTPGRVAVCAGKVRAGSVLSSFLVGDCAFSAKLPPSTCSTHAECFPHLLGQTALPVKVD